MISFEGIMKDDKNKERYEWIIKHPNKIISWLNFHKINFNVTVNGPKGTEIWKFPYNEKLSSNITGLYLKYNNRKKIEQQMKKEGYTEKQIKKELGEPDYFPY